MTLELNFCLARSQTLPRNLRTTGSESAGSDRSTERWLDNPKGYNRLGGPTNVLDNIVSKGILDKLKGMRSDPLDQLQLLVPRGMIDAPLQDTATVAVGTNGNAILSNGIENKLYDG